MLAERIISLKFTKTDGRVFSETGTNTMEISGLRTQCNIINYSGVTMGYAELRIYGLTFAQLNDLSALNRVFMAVNGVRLDISAGDKGKPINLIFSGGVSQSQLDLNNAPDSALVIIAQAGLQQLSLNAQPVSYPANTTHLIALADLAKKMNLNFEGVGTPQTLITQYLFGSYRDQVIRVCDAAGCAFVIEEDTLAVWDRYGYRNTSSVPVVSPDTGMVGYPAYSELGISIRTLFNAFLRIGCKLEVQSSLSFANGIWAAYYISHELDTEMTSGKWFTSFLAMPPDGLQLNG